MIEYVFFLKVIEGCSGDAEKQHAAKEKRPKKKDV